MCRISSRYYFTVHKVRKNQEKLLLRTARKSQGMLLKLEGSREKVSNFFDA